MNAGRNFVKCLECGEIIHLPGDTEDNQPQAESGTTGCSDAGGGDTPCKPGRSADWQAELYEGLLQMRDGVSRIKSKTHFEDPRDAGPMLQIVAGYERLASFLEDSAAAK